jgi:long-subunit fatty acid transport protein
MKKNKLFYLIAIHLTLVVNNFIHATSPSALSLRIPQGARGIALGNAYISVTDDPTAIHWNPAGLVDVSRISANLSYNSYIFNIQSFFASLACPITLSKNKLLLGGAFMYSDLGIVEGRNETRTQTEFVSLYDSSLIISIAYKINEIYSIGGNVKYITTKLWSGEENKSYAFSGDLGAKAKLLGSLINTAVVVRNLGTKLKYGNSVENSLPLDVELGVSVKPIKKLLLSSDISIQSNSSVKLRFGTEYIVNPTFALRGGINTESKCTVSIGAGIKMPISISVTPASSSFGTLGFLTPQKEETEVQEKNVLFLDYAYTHYIITNIGGTHRVSLTVKF